MLAIPALLGFAYQRPYGTEYIWQALCLVLVALFVMQIFSEKTKKLFAKGWKLGVAATVMQIALGAPAMWALIEYAFVERFMWR